MDGIGLTITEDGVLRFAAFVGALALVWKLLVSPALRWLRDWKDKVNKLLALIEHEVKPNGGRNTKPGSPQQRQDDKDATLKDTLLDIRNSNVRQVEQAEAARLALEATQRNQHEMKHLLRTQVELQNESAEYAYRSVKEVKEAIQEIADRLDSDKEQPS